MSVKEERDKAKNFFIEEEVGCSVENESNGCEVRRTSNTEYTLYQDERRVKRVKNVDLALDFLFNE